MAGGVDIGSCYIKAILFWPRRIRRNRCEAYDHGAAALAELTASGGLMTEGLLARSKGSIAKRCCSYWRWRRSRGRRACGNDVNFNYLYR
jgi:hypothetical protein